MKVLKGILCVIGALALIVIVLAIVFFTVASKAQAAPEDYTETLETGGELEAKYLHMGAHEVSYLEQNGMHDFKKYEIYYPSDISDSDPCPVVIFSNGTGVLGSKYPAVLRHLASWGFIVMATEEEYSWNGFSSEMCLRYIIQLHETETVEGWESNPFYQHVDLDNIGVSGHSQGGVGVINAATENKSGGRIKAIFAASPANLELAHALQWDYDPALITVPTFLVSSTGDGDENLVVSGAQLQAIYDGIPDSAGKIMMRRTGADHGDMLYAADGYMTAWFLWQLQGDQDAAKAFVGESAEILHNPLYQDQQVSLP